MAELEIIPSAFSLSQNYPNPFNPTTVINYQLPMTSDVKLSIYNTAGQLVRTLVNGEMPAGSHAITWDATGNSGQRVASGVYLYVIRAGEFTSQKKLILMK
ncbi:MAG: T9SS type A sorting domain-containing protein [Deferribacteres bacterium]|nr:T9SS type A sorting domain-containing protein [candidate division KSB1 bacterium]MCB9509222.1 T9SS type A sorting domain-containing protein [Deferribacteres bacterium]